MDLDRFLYLLFGIPCIFMEFYISKNKYSSSSKSLSKDRGTFIFIWLFIMCSQGFSAHYVRLGYGSKIIENHLFKFCFWIPFSITLYLTGFFIRKQSIEQLGKWFTTVIRIDEHQQLIDFGWYGKMRHPSYTGVLSYFLALALLLNNWLSLFSTMIPICLVFFYRIYIEEHELGKHFGIQYEEYKQKVPNILIPKVF
jgi:protein-S-isoprenylcysteine O-methyltransferase Ste14